MQPISGLLHDSENQKFELHKKDVLSTFLIIFLCGSCQFAEEQTVCGAQSSKSFLHIVVLSFQSFEQLLTSSHSGDGTDCNLFCSGIPHFEVGRRKFPPFMYATGKVSVCQLFAV